ncbi:hypothetical protein CXG81DRAFT_27450 [Caulochytrium protostelioides]|uniref:J domain-containing protein n=1 Tax=Caulochytrium protostelioides TaxID=1555241 RepID=A0A4P9X456_9FUNG|nr:hypothetical protein CXG81DRAFT_27450 [Caulochytrium protostelioides]|eukprot:RKO99824.1 hypothetical protein CXG81DRAFT_27450 [Caulochytrium protostelioides]
MATTSGSYKNYYAILGIERHATLQHIQEAYRNQALHCHPDKAADPAAALPRFLDLSEAYDVLSVPERRALYHEGGYPALARNYRYHGDPMATFTAVLGGANPFSAFLHPSVLGGDGKRPERHAASFAAGFGGLHGMAATADAHADAADGGVIPSQTVPSPDQTVVLPVTLEEIDAGCTKRLTYDRVTLGADQATLTVPTPHTVNVAVGRGWPSGTTLRFRGQGSVARIGATPGDLVVVLQEAPHPRFTRKGADLELATEVSLVQALTGLVMDVPTLDGRLLKIPITETVQPNYVKIVVGEGLVKPRAPGALPGGKREAETRGDLRLAFTVRFPTSCTDEQKAVLKQVFRH